MRISECMTLDVQSTTPRAAIRAAARLMAEHDLGFLPVAENDRLVG